MSMASVTNPTDGIEGRICPAGYYCPKGTITPIACPIGKYNPAVGKIAISDCLDCELISYCTEKGLT